MSADTTSSSKRGMDCDRAAREEVFESYLADRLSEEDRAAFEEHYLGCARCFDELQTLQDIRDVLSDGGGQSERTTARRLRGWAPALGLAATVVLATGAMLWMRSPTPAGATRISPTAAAIAGDLVGAASALRIGTGGCAKVIARGTHASSATSLPAPEAPRAA